MRAFAVLRNRPVTPSVWQATLRAAAAMLVITPSGVNRRRCGAFTRARHDSIDMAPNAISNRSGQCEV
jgi:hypothetical protein